MAHTSCLVNTCAWPHKSLLGFELDVSICNRVGFGTYDFVRIRWVGSAVQLTREQPDTALLCQLFNFRRGWRYSTNQVMGRLFGVNTCVWPATAATRYWIRKWTRASNWASAGFGTCDFVNLGLWCARQPRPGATAVADKT